MAKILNKTNYRFLTFKIYKIKYVIILEISILVIIFINNNKIIV